MVETIATFSVPRPDLTGLVVNFKLPEICPLSKLPLDQRAHKRLRKKELIGVVAAIGFIVEMKPEFADMVAKGLKNNQSLKRSPFQKWNTMLNNAKTKKERQKLSDQAFTPSEAILLCVGCPAVVQLNLLAEEGLSPQSLFEDEDSEGYRIKDPFAFTAITVKDVISSSDYDHNTLLTHEHWFPREAAKRVVRNKGKRPIAYQWPNPSMFFTSPFFDPQKRYIPDEDDHYHYAPLR